MIIAYAVVSAGREGDDEIEQAVASEVDRAVVGVVGRTVVRRAREQCERRVAWAGAVGRGQGPGRGVGGEARGEAAPGIAVVVDPVARDLARAGVDLGGLVVAVGVEGVAVLVEIVVEGVRVAVVVEAIVGHLGGAWVDLGVGVVAVEGRNEAVPVRVDGGVPTSGAGPAGAGGIARWVGLSLARTAATPSQHHHRQPPHRTSPAPVARAACDRGYQGVSGRRSASPPALNIVQQLLWVRTRKARRSTSPTPRPAGPGVGRRCAVLEDCRQSTQGSLFLDVSGGVHLHSHWS